jgi:hypothetical protein
MTMRSFGSAELSRLQSTQESAMQDRAVRLMYQETADDYGNPSPHYQTMGGEEFPLDFPAAYADLICGLEHLNPEEMQNTGEVPRITARLRLPIDTVIDERDRIQMTHRYGVPLDTEQVFEIVGPVRRGPSGLVLDLALCTRL